MAGYDSNVMLNIIPIFNTASADGNVDTTNTLSNSIAALQTMINTTSQTITTDSIRTFNSATLEILNDTNVTGTLTINNKSVFDIGGSNFNVSTANLSISTGSIGLFLLSTSLINNEIGGFQLYASTIFSIDSNNNFVFQPFNNALVSNAIVRISTLPLVVDTANISSLYLDTLSVTRSSIFNTIYSSNISVTRSATVQTLSSIFINTSHTRTSSIEVLNPVRNLVVSSMNTSTNTIGLINFNDSFNHRSNQLYSYSNILYFNKQPIGGTLSYSFETITF